jgi:hypothetical protein
MTSQTDINKLVSDLVCINPNQRISSANALRGINQPILLNILVYANKTYKQFCKIQSNYNNQIKLNPYGKVSWVIGYQIGERMVNNAFKSNINRLQYEWQAAIDGAKLYITISCDSVNDGIIELIRTIVQTKNVEYEQQAHFIIHYCGPQIIEPLIELAMNEDEIIRGAAVLFLSIQKDVRSYEPIKRALNDKSPFVRNAAATAIKNLGLDLGNKEVYIEKETIREIVKIPCKYCGTLMENTSRFCPSCGASLT